MTELEGQAKFKYPSATGHSTQGMNMGQITQIAFELRNITQKQMDDDDSGDEDIAMDKMQEKREWMTFCEKKINKIEKLWNRKLEKDHSDSEDDDRMFSKKSEEKEEDDEDNNEQMISNLLNNFDSNRIHRGNTVPHRPAAKDKNIEDTLKSLEPKAKDTNDLEDLSGKQEYANNNYWRPVSQYSLEDLGPLE